MTFFDIPALLRSIKCITKYMIHPFYLIHFLRIFCLLALKIWN